MQPVNSVQANVHPGSKSLGRRFRDRIALFFRKHRKKKIAALILLCGLLIMLRVFGQQPGGVPVNVAEAVQDSFEQNIFAAGKLEVKDLTEFMSESDTTIQDILVGPGDKVAKGQVVLVTDTTGLATDASQKRLACEEIRAKIVSSESSIKLLQQAYDLAQKDYANTKALFESGAVSATELEQAERKLIEAEEDLVVEREANLPLLIAQLEQAGFAYQQAQEKLQKATVVSPCDGMVLKLPVKKGQEVEAGALLVQIGDPSNLLIETGINEVDAAQLTVGDRVEIANNALLDEPLFGTVESIAPIAEVVTTAQGEQTQVKIRVNVPATREQTLLKPGFNVNLKVVLNQKEQALLVPYEAVVEEDGQELVYVVEQDGTVTQRAVRAGLSNELFMEITFGLQAGEKVVLNPGEQIKDGVQVIVNAQGN